jgi:[CysO sulfur-carrier protein]-S-L-cysteine hydrolase
VRIRRAFLEEILRQARDEYPNECCGIVATSDGEATRVFPAENLHHSPTRFEIDGRHVMHIQDEIDKQGWELGSLYHSHTRTAAYPSQTDVNFAANWPGLIWLIVSLEEPEKPSVRAFEIVDGSISERDFSVDG